jgi:hypothetical protein
VAYSFGSGLMVGWWGGLKLAEGRSVYCGGMAFRSRFLFDNVAVALPSALTIRSRR